MRRPPLRAIGAGCRRPGRLAGAVLAASLALTGTLSPARATAQQPSAASRLTAYEELQTLSGVLNYVRMNYVDSVSYHELVRAAIGGVLRSLDPHSAFLSPEQSARLEALGRGELGDVGIDVVLAGGNASVQGVGLESPADRAGVLAGDRILLIDDTSTAGMSLRDVQLRLMGLKGSRVRLTLLRGRPLAPDTLRLRLRRERMEERSVSIVRTLDARTGYVRLARFGPGAAKELREALDGLRSGSAAIGGGGGGFRTILDLRGDPGGLVVSAVDVASLFLPKGTVVFRTRGRLRSADQEYRARGGDDFRDLPLVVLIDESSASASEALAGALQDHDRAVIAGRRSFGKALMQQDFPLPSGDIVHLTTGRVISPSGRFIQRRYDDLTPEQYVGLAGQGGLAPDTIALFHTDAGRPVHGGGGIAPDVALPPRAALPSWWSAAADSALDAVVADSVAATLGNEPAARRAWLVDTTAWRVRLVEPFLARVQTRLDVHTPPAPEAAARIARILAGRVARVRWGNDAWDEFFVAHDPDIAAARALFESVRR